MCVRVTDARNNVNPLRAHRSIGITAPFLFFLRLRDLLARQYSNIILVSQSQMRLAYDDNFSLHLKFTHRFFDTFFCFFPFSIFVLSTNRARVQLAYASCYNKTFFSYYCPQQQQPQHAAVIASMHSDEALVGTWTG